MHKFHYRNLYKGEELQRYSIDIYSLVVFIYG
jgi:hypothetical protein